jgi:hypothetical protein
MSTTISSPETAKDFTRHPDAESALRTLRRLAAENRGVSAGEFDCYDADECTYETYEIEEAEELEELEEAEDTDESNERDELDSLGIKLLITVDDAILECGVGENGDVNRPLFMLAHKVRSIEEERNVRFSPDVLAQVVDRWKASNDGVLEDDHDYFTEFVDKLSLVHYPSGHALANAVEIAKGRVPPKHTVHMSRDVQLLACLCAVLQDQARDRPFFLDGRSAARLLGRPHETVASWLRALCQLGVIKRVSRGTRGMASRYLYLASKGS